MAIQHKVTSTTLFTFNVFVSVTNYFNQFQARHAALKKTKQKTVKAFKGGVFGEVITVEENGQGNTSSNQDKIIYISHYKVLIKNK